MKKAIAIAAFIFAASTILPSCSSTKTAASTSSASHGRVSGNWSINSINYEGIGENSVKSIFDLAAPSAFQGSTWMLTGSGNGSITLNNGTTQPIYWSMLDGQSPSMFQFKKINTGEKAKNIDAGYKMDVSSSDANNLVLRLPVQNGGTTAYIVFNMVKK